MNGMHLFQHHQLPTVFKMDMKKLEVFLNTIELGYPCSNPYHNRVLRDLAYCCDKYVTKCAGCDSLGLSVTGGMSCYRRYVARQQSLEVSGGSR